jgi:hypothetical protein
MHQHLIRVPSDACQFIVGYFFGKCFSVLLPLSHNIRCYYNYIGCNNILSYGTKGVFVSQVMLSPPQMRKKVTPNILCGSWACIFISQISSVLKMIATLPVPGSY